MSTVIVMWCPDDRGAKPVGTVDNVDAGKEWCQAQANRLAQDVLPLLEWQHYLSRGTGPSTAHYVSSWDDRYGAFEIWIVGSLKTERANDEVYGTQLRVGDIVPGVGTVVDTAYEGTSWYRVIYEGDHSRRTLKYKNGDKVRVSLELAAYIRANR